MVRICFHAVPADPLRLCDRLLGKRRRRQYVALATHLQQVAGAHTTAHSAMTLRV